MEMQIENKEKSIDVRLESCTMSFSKTHKGYTALLHALTQWKDQAANENDAQAVDALNQVIAHVEVELAGGSHSVN